MTEQQGNEHAASPKTTDDHEAAALKEHHLEIALENSMDASDPPSLTQPGDNGEPVPSSGFIEDEEQPSLGQRAVPGSGPVHGSGADAGGTATPDEDYARDAVAGGGALRGEDEKERPTHGTAEDIIVPPSAGSF